jgi:hypothetical protein
LTIQCPQCGAETRDEDWNCASCRVNLYWARQHYKDLAELRQNQGLPPGASTPPFLIKTQQDAMEERAGRGGRVEHKVRRIARLFMRRER